MTTTPETLTTGIVDIHNGDGTYNLDAFKAGGGVAFIHKITEGGDFVDKAYAKAVPAAISRELMIGLYHFANATDPVKQAEHFLTHAKAFPGALLILDCEKAPAGSKFGTMNAAQACAFVTRVFEITGRWPVFYTYDSMLRNMMKGATPEQRATLSKCPLWIAKYGPAPAAFPASWNAWPTWFLWQYTSSLLVGPADKVKYPRGVPGFTRKSQDRSVFRGTVDELRAAWSSVGRPA